MSTYSIENGIIHYVADEDTGRVEDIPIADILELVLWLRKREGVLRKMVFDKDPMPSYSPMRLLNGYYVGVCGEGPYHRAKVKVKASRWDEILEQTANVVRSNWLYDLRQADLG